MDNEASMVVKTWLTSNNIQYQLATVDNQCTNVAKRCIETAKHHIIAGLATTDPEFPIQQWNRLIPQAQHTLNMLPPTRLNPQVSAFTFLEGQYNYDAVPFAPPGWKVLVFEDPSRRCTWDPHRVERFAVGPALEHYHNYQFFVPSKGALCTTNTISFFTPKHLQLPTTPKPEEILVEAAKALETAMKAVANENPAYPQLEQYRQLERITDLVKDTTTRLIPDNDGIIHINTPSLPLEQTKSPAINLIPNDEDDDEAPPRVKRHNSTRPPRVRKQPRQDDDFGRILEPTQHRYPTWSSVNHIETIDYNVALPPYLVNAITDETTSKLHPLAYATLHGTIIHMLNAVIHGKTGKKMEYQHLISDDEMKELWGTAMHIELGCLMKGTKSGIIGMKTMTPIQKQHIAKDRKVTYLRIVVDIRPHKEVKE